ncbi:Kunitz-type trypsin inhibitor-like 1 protein, partial [Mucuna pruriens]
MKVSLLMTLFFVFITSLPSAFSQGAQQVESHKENPFFLVADTIFGPAGGGAGLGRTDSNSTCLVTNSLVVKSTIPGENPGSIFTDTPLDIAFEKKA